MNVFQSCRVPDRVSVTTDYRRRVTAVPWHLAWHEALYGPHGFYRRPEGPAGHFRTASHIPVFAEALADLAAEVDRALGHPDHFTVVDVGAGRGELLTAMAPHVPDRWELLAVDVVERPASLDSRIGWAQHPPDATVGLLLAIELLDVVPCPVVQIDDDGTVRGLLVDPETGVETLGERAAPSDTEWLEAWWHLDIGERAEVGRPRDELWHHLLTTVIRGAALAVDYSHSRDERDSGAWPQGTLASHANGRALPAIPDGTCDVTAHVALDACAAAGGPLCDLTLLTSQRQALQQLGVSAATPDSTTATTDPRGYGAALQHSAQARELLDPEGLGGFGWLFQGRGVSPTARAPE